jgi:hypothetical protein
MQTTTVQQKLILLYWLESQRGHIHVLTGDQEHNLWATKGGKLTIRSLQLPCMPRCHQNTKLIHAECFPYLKIVRLLVVHTYSYVHTQFHTWICISMALKLHAPSWSAADNIMLLWGPSYIIVDGMGDAGMYLHTNNTSTSVSIHVLHNRNGPEASLLLGNVSCTCIIVQSA